jgi:REP element-mobilizing transposase RayT
MSVKKAMPFNNGVYFITFTCYNWLPLFEITNTYNYIYKQFDILKQENHYIIGYVLMPNHIHVLIAFTNSNKNINNRIGTIKRFLAYEIINKLKALDRNDLLETLANGVKLTDKKRGKLHEVFEPSFDCKECNSEEMILQKLDYMHMNPCKGKWHLVKNPADYTHSSACYYITSEQGIYNVTNYMKLMDIDLSGAL